MDMNRPRDWGAGCGTLRCGPHRGSPERSCSRGLFSWALVAPKLGHLSRAPERRGSSNYIPWVTFLLFFPRKIFIVIIKTWTSQIRAPQKSFPLNIFFSAHLFLFSAHEKAVFAIWRPSVVYGTNYNATEQFGTVTFLLMRNMWGYKGFFL